MKLTPRFPLIIKLFFISVLFNSCGVDQEFLLDAVLEDEDPVQTDGESENEGMDDLPGAPNIPDADSESFLPVNNDGCDYDLSSLESGGTLSLECALDLAGNVVDLPSNVTLQYDGGQIYNGTLKFNGGQIDGRLLNHELNVEGNVSLIDPVFVFYFNRWNLAQGSTTSDIALQNRDMMELAINQSKTLGAHTFVVNELDAYFEVTKFDPTVTNYYPTREAINIPSDFTFIMSDNTILRVFPNNASEYSLLAVRDASNVNVVGGRLYGDRDEHDYSQGGTQEWGHLLDLHAAVNTHVSGVFMKNALGDGMKIHSLNFTYVDTYRPSNNIVVTDCIFDNNRRNNLSITDGFNILIDKNQFLNASNDTPNSEGVAPGFGVVVESTRKRLDNGEFLYYEYANDILIRGNTESNSRRGAITVAIGYDVTIEGNFTENGISYSTANGTRIVGNTVTAVTQEARENGTGIKAGKASSNSDTIFDNKVIGNNVIGYNIAYNIGNDDVEVYDNTAEDFKTGIFPVKLSNAKIYGNTLRSNRENCHGVFVFSTDIRDIEFYNNTIEIADGNPYKFTAVNEDIPSPLDANIIVRNDNLIAPDNSVHFNRANGIQFLNNELDHGLEVFSSNDLIISNNSINTVGNNDHGIYIREVNNDITINSNSIQVDATKNCIEIQSSTNASEVSTNNNQCGN
nr:hypothetical protein [Allomuricauda sp.]